MNTSPDKQSGLFVTAFMTGAQVRRVLQVSDAWLSRHRELFDCIQIPGRGATGREYRYTSESVLAFRNQGLRPAETQGRTRGPNIREITALVMAMPTTGGTCSF
jgi:hypothetical protein